MNRDVLRKSNVAVAFGLNLAFLAGLLFAGVWLSACAENEVIGTSGTESSDSRGTTGSDETSEDSSANESSEENQATLNVTVSAATYSEFPLILHWTASSGTDANFEVELCETDLSVCETLYTINCVDQETFCTADFASGSEWAPWFGFIDLDRSVGSASAEFTLEDGTYDALRDFDLTSPVLRVRAVLEDQASEWVLATLAE